VVAWSLVDSGEFLQQELRLHELLDGVPLHDVWRIELPGGGDGLDLQALRPLMQVDQVMSANPAVRALFALRGWLGNVFGWDDGEPASISPESYLHRLSDADRAASVEPPGTREGPFTILYVFANETVSEIRNKTVHAFSALTLRRRPGGYTAYWAIYVLPIGSGRLTRGYMALIDPFRRYLVYPAILRRVHRLWSERYAHDPRPPSESESESAA
jgi:hypothetical protein